MDSGAKLSGYEKEKYLIKLEKEFAYAGASIPFEIEMDGETFRLKSFVYDMSLKKGNISQEENERIDRIISKAKKKKREIIEKIKNCDLTEDEAIHLFDLARGLGRAIDSLYSAPEPKTSIDEERKKAKLEEGRRWLDLVRKVYSKEKKTDIEKRSYND